MFPADQRVPVPNADQEDAGSLAEDSEHNVDEAKEDTGRDHARA